ncbi:MAG: DUF1570 domain-containing protein [Planctomycetaceae bacterium]
MHRLTIALVWFCVVTVVGDAWSAETIQFRDSKGVTRDVVGESLVQAQDGGRLFQADDGRIWTIQPDMILASKADNLPVVPVDDAEIARRLLEELPEGFSVYQTTNFVIAHNTNENYVRWVGGLFEQLHRGFYAYWKNQGWDLPKTQFPLVALVFADRDHYDAYAKNDVGNAAKSTIGYYNLETNRMTTYNVPNAERNVATIIHEATHQLAFNTGLQKRYADNPMWVSEGLAVFFESPDFSNPRGWRTIGKVNTVNLGRFRRYAPRRGADSLATLLADDDRFRQEASAADAYSEAWALTYFLLRTKKKEYIQYLQTLSEGKPLVTRTARERIEIFEQAIGVDLATLDRQFMAYMARVQ